ncbi:UNVERIFIED_CONTAM: putative cation transporter HKT6 [Sesamum calycinum]|uniref:Cation transporter HKT6 n=1 Tax=Sesamum calycinum TaxID=2727403 RepID=A0AAW2N2L5_9LAMI
MGWGGRCEEGGASQQPHRPCVYPHVTCRLARVQALDYRWPFVAVPTIQDAAKNFVIYFFSNSERVNPFLTYILYFISLSLVGFGVLKALKPRTLSTPRNIDLFFTSVSAATVSSMSTVEMERSKIIRTWKSEVKVESVESDPRSPPPVDPSDQIELNIVTVPERGLAQFESQHDVFSSYNPFLKYDSIKFLGFLVLGYLVVIHILGVTSVLIYLALVSSANNVLRNKGIKTFTFAIFTIVSTFASCGFVPTNENMIVFGKNSGLLWILIPQVLVGNIVPFLFEVSNMGGWEENKEAALSGLNTYQKVVGILFQCVNARHSGETIVDLSTIAPAILVFFVVMMYLPPYTSFLPIKRDEQSQLESEGKEKRREKFADNLIFSQLSYLVIFIILICITERKSMKEDPINFSVLNIIVEVISAYGNVGFTTGYSCERQLRPDPNCVNKWYGFSGKWSDEGKVILIIVMFFGRLKKFNMNGGLAWKLL